MLRCLGTIALGCVLAACGSSQTGPGWVDRDSAEREIGQMLDAWHAAAATGDGPGYFGRMTPDAVFLGTDAGERWTKGEFESAYGSYFDGDEAWTYVPTERWVESGTAPSGVVWFDELLTNAKYGTSRGSGVAVFDASAGRWKVAAYSLSFPIPNELAGDMTQEIKAFEANEREARP